MQRFGPYHPGHPAASAAGVFGNVMSAPYARNAGIQAPNGPQVGATIYPSLSSVFFQTRWGVVQTISPAQRTASQVVRGGDNG